MGDIPSGSEVGLEKAVLQILQQAPEKWSECNQDDFTAVEQKALGLLTAAGMVERRFSIRLSLVGHQVRIELTAKATGEYGLAKALEPALRQAWDAWSEFYKECQSGPEEEKPTFFCEKTAPEMWRLTDQGVLARQDLEKGNAKVVLDFVLRRTLVFKHKTVPGDGRLERIEAIKQESAPTKVEVTNLDQLSDPMAQIAQILQAGFDKLTTAASQPAKSKTTSNGSSKTRRGRPKVSKNKAEKQHAILERWERAKEANISRAKFCEDEGISVKELERIQDWSRQREKRE
jgi:hypothetical protein